MSKDFKTKINNPLFNNTTNTSKENNNSGSNNLENNIAIEKKEVNNLILDKKKGRPKIDNPKKTFTFYLSQDNKKHLEKIRLKRATEGQFLNISELINEAIEKLK